MNVSRSPLIEARALAHAEGSMEKLLAETHVAVTLARHKLSALDRLARNTHVGLQCSRQPRTPGMAKHDCGCEGDKALMGFALMAAETFRMYYDVKQPQKRAALAPMVLRIAEAVPDLEVCKRCGGEGLYRQTVCARCSGVGVNLYGKWWPNGFVDGAD